MTTTTGTITATTLNIRPTPSTEFAPIGKLRQGQTIAVAAQRDGWLRLHSGGYVSAQYVTLASTGGASEGTDTASASPVLLPDVYRNDAGGHPDWSALAADSRFFGAILKATEGTSYAAGEPWFLANWPAARAAGGTRSGVTWFRGCYHYLLMADSGAQQAEYYLQMVSKAGGFGDGDLPPIVDVERGSQSSSNHKASKQQVMDVTSEWVETVKSALGCKVMLYGRGAMRDLGITDRMGCDTLWAPQYNWTLDSTSDIGWPANLVTFWQYTDGQDNFTSYPDAAPGIGKDDLNLFLGGTVDALREFVTACGPGAAVSRT